MSKSPRTSGHARKRRRDGMVDDGGERRSDSGRGVLVPVKAVAQCDYCRGLLGDKPHPMMPKRPKQDHCTCVLVTEFQSRES
jgi:hypothetical protein